MNERLIKEIRKEISNYKDTVHAIITFCCLYKYDQRTSRDNVKIFQGRRFIAKNNKKVTPAIAIQIDEKNGIIAEVKNSFPTNQEYPQPIRTRLNLPHTEPLPPEVVVNNLSPRPPTG